MSGNSNGYCAGHRECMASIDRRQIRIERDLTAVLADVQKSLGVATAQNARLAELQAETLELVRSLARRAC